MPEDMVTITMTRAQAEYVEQRIMDDMPRGQRGREFAAWRAVKKALGTWRHRNKSPTNAEIMDKLL